MGYKITVLDKAKSLGEFLLSEDLSLATDSEYERRFTICKLCEHYSPKGNFSLGECKLCGCTRLKLKFSSAKCKLGKWTVDD